MTLDWLAPEALPFFMGVELAEAIGRSGFTGDGLVTALAASAEPMLEMSMLQSLNDLIDSVSYAESSGKLPAIAGSALVSYLSQAIPTIGGQIERTAEDRRMSTYTDKSALLPTDIQYAMGRASARIPGRDYQQVPYIDAWGREEPTGALPMRAFNNFLNPAYTSFTNVTAADAEIQRLYDRTGYGSVVPSRAPRSFTVDGKEKYLNGEEYVTYAKKRGETAYNVLSYIIGSDAYRSMSDEDKADLVSDVYQYADAVGKAAVSGYEPDGWVAKAMSSGVPAGAYMLYRSTADANGDGTVSGSEAAHALLPLSGLNDRQKGKVWQSQDNRWNEEKNPFTGALSAAGIPPETAADILTRYGEIDRAAYSGDSVPRQKQTELSKYLDGLGLTAEQRAVVDDTFRFYSMFPAKVLPYSICTMSDAAQKKWPAAQAWGMSEEDYLKYYAIYSGDGKKADKIRKLQEAGMTGAQAGYFWSIMSRKQ